MDDLTERLRTRAKIRRSIPTRRSVQEGEPDRIAALLDEAADEIQRLQCVNGELRAVFRVNMLLYCPKASHAVIDAALKKIE